ncbi:Calx-beta domain-containing protein, partial [Muricoccus aerilatus]|uniref:Calx-beta domain-containing protein n=1 Tax=Muricoccus aerilatus TaxID=452982 RepID=UPI0005C1ED27
MSTIYVSATAANGIPAGNDTTGDGSRERPWATIDKANAVAANGDTVLLNDGVYSPAKTLVISNSVTWLPVTDYGATIRGVSGQSRVIGISEDNGGTVTFGKIIIDGINANAALITVNDQATAYTLHLDGTKLVNPVSYGIQGVSTGTHAHLDLENVQFSGSTALSMINVQALIEGSVSITGGTVNLPGVARSGFGGIATINADGNDVPVVISGVTANLNAAGASGIYYGIRLTDVAHPLIEHNDITQTGTTSDQIGTTILVTVDPDTPYDASNGVIRYNTLRNFIDGDASKLILVGADSDPGAIARNHVNNYQIYGNTGIGDTGSEGSKLHGILVGWQNGAQVYDNSMDYTDLAYVLKGMSGETLVFDNTDTHTSGKSLYQKGGTGVQFLYNTSYQDGGYNPDIINIGDLSDSAYNASNATIIGNTVAFTGTPDSFLAVSPGSSTTSIAGNEYYAAAGNASSAWLYKGTSYKTIDAWKAAAESSATYGPGATIGQGAILGAVSVSGQELKLIGMVNGVQTYYIDFVTGTASQATFAIGNLGAEGAATISGLVDADLTGNGSASLSGTGLVDRSYGPLAGGDVLTFSVSYDGLSALGGMALHVYGNYTNTRPIDIIFGGAIPVAPSTGNDTISATDQDNTIYALAGNDTVNGAEGDDTVWAGAGDDRIIGGAGDDWISGEGGTDTAVFSAAREDVTVSRGADGSIVVTSSEGTDTLIDVEFFTFAGTTFTPAELTASRLALSGPLTQAEGNSGSTAFAYTVTRTGDLSGTSTAQWSVTGSGSNAANAADFGGTLPSGTVSFAAGEASKTITVSVAGDALAETDETFTLTLASPSSGTTITTATATGTIQND